MLTTLLRGSPQEHYAPDESHDESHPSGTEVDEDSHGFEGDEAEDLMADEWDASNGARLVRHPSRLETVPEVDEHSPLLNRVNSKHGSVFRRRRDAGEGRDVEAQWNGRRLRFLKGSRQLGHRFTSRLSKYSDIALHPRKWDPTAIWQATVVRPASYLPAVLVGLLLNILDALSYGEFYSSLAASSHDALIFVWYRHDLVSISKSYFLPSWIGWHLYLLR